MLNAHETHREVVAGRPGEWMHTLSGKKFFPLDPRPEDIDLLSIANGLAKEERYGGQTRIEYHYSVAEHCFLMALHAYRTDNKHPVVCLAVLFHDAAEAYCKDLPKAVKDAVGESYASMESKVLQVILRKYNLLSATMNNMAYIKELDRRIIPVEKAKLVLVPQPWKADQFEPLPVEIQCWERGQARTSWLNLVYTLAYDAGWTITD